MVRTADGERKQLKSYFQNGKVPNEKSFADLIDKMALVMELPACPPPEPCVAPPQDPPRATTAPPQALRIGDFDPAAPPAPPAPLDRARLRQSCRAPADGCWHPVVENLRDCYAFEVVACASGMAHTGSHAVTHAIAVVSLGGRGSVRATYSAGPQRWRPWWLPPCLRRRDQRHRVEFKWVPAYDGGELPGATLLVRTSGDFRTDESGQVMIEYHITRLW